MPSASDHAFPRSAIGVSLGAEVRRHRRARRWSQEMLAIRLGVHRRTVIRLEGGTHAPTSHLIHAIEEVLDIASLVPAWREAPRASDPCYGPRVRAVRRAAGVTAAMAAAASGVSPATFSRFERGAPVEAIVGRFGADDEGIRSDALARLLGFDDAAALDGFCMSGRREAAVVLARLAECTAVRGGRRDRGRG